MATVSGSVEGRIESFSKRFNWDYFLQDNLTGSVGLTIWVVFITAVTIGITILGFNNAPSFTLIGLILWAVGVVMVVVNEVFNLHIGLARWLKENIFSSVSNTVVTLLLLSIIALAVNGLYQWGIVTATFSPEMTAPDVRSSGASWGVLWGAKKILLTGLLDPKYNGRVLGAFVMVLALWAMSFITTRPGLREPLTPVRKITNFLWILSPFISFLLLAGLAKTDSYEINWVPLVVGTVVAIGLMLVLYLFRVIQLTPASIAVWALAWPIAYLVWKFIAFQGWFTPISSEDWGGLMLTVIFAIFVNLLSLPLGIVLALGRRTIVQGIPWWIIWPIAIFFTILFFSRSTPGLWETSRNNFERALALWPIIIPLAAWGLNSYFKGNVPQMLSVLYIELIRGVPLITLLFMAIVMSPWFTADFRSVASFWAVIVGYTIFSSAYMAELVRGGLQAIPKGQYEASAALGFNSLQTYRFIIMPQALRILIPPLTGSVIGTFKSSSLVSLVGMVDLVGATPRIIGNPNWLGLRDELYVFMFVLYFVVSSVVSWYGRRLEERTGLGVR
ncbi:MAG: ABC transporter permease subunit [Anaerolineales bacterium]|nr:ABC transporter permease subunit [Anaerolineales bacterium]MCB0013097.1 ABC transporter permease subunit [Anaerolineales bacterium]MCB0018217.1 ABC transporter permease subunit [Anaerolineales bacterium]MCB0031815.1 ABC transporter permease subunit [Anaerolineales bacterium]MCB8961590.1 ABC transporter permease subunit [Ardenticatenales bacterium]